MVTEKTGSLIATAGRFGAMFSGAPAGAAEKVMNVCAALGVAYQMSDDILDVATGLKPGTYYAKGVAASSCPASTVDPTTASFSTSATGANW